MKTRVALSGTALALALATSGAAQTPPAQVPQPGNTVLIAQYECAPGELQKVDQLIKDNAAPVFNRMVSEGKLISWGLLGASVGGPSNRTIYVWAKDPVALMQARQQYLPEIMAKPSWPEVGRLCPRQQVTLNSLIANVASTK